MELDKKNVILLIQEYEKRRILWDSQDKWYFHKQKKIDAWREIANIFKLAVEDIKKKISSLLGSFRRERAKGKKSVGTGEGAHEVYKSDWFAFNSFAFLLDKDKSRSSIKSEDLIDQENSEIDICEAIIVLQEDGMELLPSDSFPGNENITTCTIPTPKTQKENKNLKRRREQSEEKEDPRIEMAFQMLTAPEDSTTKFVTYIAEKLNEFNPQTKATVIHKINSLIFEAEIEKFAEND